MLPDQVALALTDPQRPREPEYPQEDAIVAFAVQERRHEFFAGRAAARDALSQLGIKKRPILARASRDPVWPQGVVGSISHDADACVAIASARKFEKGGIIGLGIDVEPHTGLPGDLMDLVCTEAELTWLALLSEERALRAARKVFSIKEAVYKCQFPMTRQVFGFDVLNTKLSHDMHRFEATFTRDIGCFPKDTVVHGKCGTTLGRILSVAIINSAGPASAGFL